MFHTNHTLDLKNDFLITNKNIIGNEENRILRSWLYLYSSYLLFLWLNLTFYVDTSFDLKKKKQTFKLSMVITPIILVLKQQRQANEANEGYIMCSRIICLYSNPYAIKERRQAPHHTSIPYTSLVTSVFHLWTNRVFLFLYS